MKYERLNGIQLSLPGYSFTRAANIKSYERSYEAQYVLS